MEFAPRNYNCGDGAATMRRWAGEEEGGRARGMRKGEPRNAAYIRVRTIMSGDTARGQPARRGRSRGERDGREG